MVPKGEWDASTAYTRLDVVLYNGSSWVAIADSTGQVPADGSTYWQLLASGVDITNYYTKSQVDGKMSGKQDTRLEVEFTMSTDIGTGVVTYTASKSVAEIMAAMQDGRDIIGKMGQGGMISDNYDYYHIFADKYNALLWGRLTNDANIELFVQQQSALTRHVIALQERLVSGTSIKTVNGVSLLGGGDVTIAAGEDGKSAYQSYYDTTQDNPKKTEVEWLESLKGEDGDPGATGPQGPSGPKGDNGVGFASASSPIIADGTWQIKLTNGDTITIDLNHEHPQYLKFELVQSLPASPDSGTLYLIAAE